MIQVTHSQTISTKCMIQGYITFPRKDFGNSREAPQVPK